MKAGILHFFCVCTMLEQWLPIPTKHDFKKNYMQVLIKPNPWQNPGEWAEDLRNTYFWSCTSIHLWKRTEKCWIHIIFFFLWANHSPLRFVFWKHCMFMFIWPITNICLNCPEIILADSWHCLTICWDSFLDYLHD